MEPQPEPGHSSLGQLELGYLVLEVPEPASLDAFFGEVIGLAPGSQPHTWRNDAAAAKTSPSPRAAILTSFVHDAGGSRRRS